MFYVAKLDGGRIGVADTEDGVVDWFSDKELFTLIKKHNLNIYGTSIYNYKCNPTALSINNTLKLDKLTELVNAWSKLHNQWSGYVVEDYLASAKVGTVITVDYVYTGSGGERHQGNTELSRVGDDAWLYKDDSNLLNGKTLNSRKAAWALDVACNASKKWTMSVR